ncbi:uncharacterized protein LOC123679875 isoform X2 [Harmonia axyridis]|uniref:uncharacterized protein LOC123679875 isoform X2 n=1 Tax=Harmonia axyridis TaxID=115357 RepID=UPI001E276FB5|nr:uncharacterized protein LOC123679875 isoform X2 [Harmonia axyridis]
MAKLLVSCFLIIFGSALATVETNKRGGHGLFHGFEDGKVKSSWLEETKVDDVKIGRGSTNSLLSNTISNSKKSSLYLQPEPRGLEYLLNVPDQNPLLLNFYRKRDVSKQNAFIKIRKMRQTNIQPGYVIPGSRGQAVLYGVPNGIGSQSFGYGQQQSMNNLGFPSETHQNGGFSGRENQNSHFGGYKTHGY